MPRSSLSTAGAVGAGVALAGAVLAVHWAIRIEAITGLVPGSEHLGLVNPLLFVAAGICLWHASWRSGTKGWLSTLSTLSTLSIVALVALPLGYLAENAFDLSLGIDIVRSGMLPSPAVPHPGRF